MGRPEALTAAQGGSWAVSGGLGGGSGKPTGSSPSTIRRFEDRTFSTDDLAELGFLTPGQVDLIRRTLLASFVAPWATRGTFGWLTRNETRQNSAEIERPHIQKRSDELGRTSRLAASRSSMGGGAGIPTARTARGL